MLIHDLAKATGFSVDAIRYYERLGIITPPVRRENGYREYARSTVACLSLCRRAKALGFSLKEIRELGHRLDAGLLTDAELRARVERKLSEVREKRRALAQLEGELERTLAAETVLSSGTAKPRFHRRKSH